MHRFQLFPVFLILLSYLQSADILVNGNITNKSTGEPVAGVNVISGDLGVASDEAGRYTLKIPSGSKIVFSHIGYETIELTADSQLLNIILVPIVLEGEGVYVSATRAVSGITPAAFSNLTQEEIAVRYTVEDVPMILASEPGVYAYSESGNGTGYSYLSIRGFDQSRIAVMLDNVPLNDNESHQVYWVDHADILSDASDVQIQRGIGNSLYGSSAFGGSINVSTKLAYDKPIFSVKAGSGSYNTEKLSVKGATGEILDGKLHLVTRYSQLKSDGYRDYHDSDQKAFFGGAQYRDGKFTAQLRTLIGYENSNLAWWGIFSDDIGDRKLRRAGYQAYTDDFLQQVYSLNTTWHKNENFTFSNTAYLVRGAGYYENSEYSGFDMTAGDDSSAVADYYGFLQGYNLLDRFVAGDSAQSVAFDRRKWIENSYYGIIPTLTLRKPGYRIDLGGELRIYSGDHFGELSIAGEDPGWDKYYQYIGSKRLLTAFIHSVFTPSAGLHLTADLQVQNISWELDQKKIGLAAGHQLTADWTFVNPRFGMVYELNDGFSLFLNYGKAQKEPADNQIISADDVFGEPVMAAAEVIGNYEAGGNFRFDGITGSLNAYLIAYKNEQLKNIDVEQQGEYNYYSASGTQHQGVEFELKSRLAGNYQVGINGSANNHIFTGGESKDKNLPGIPEYQLNLWAGATLFGNTSIFTSLRNVGSQYLPANAAAVSGVTLDGFTSIDFGFSIQYGSLIISGKVNNLLDTLYSTAGFDWDGWLYYWPAATRNGFVSLEMII